MVFTDPIMITHANRIAYQPLMSSMVAERYKSANATNIRNNIKNHLL
jgi:hypothetical protein